MNERRDWADEELPAGTGSWYKMIADTETALVVTFTQVVCNVLE